MDILTKFPQMKLLRLVDLIESHKMVLVDYIYNIGYTWTSMGYDELDIVEFIMLIEKKLDINIPDEITHDLLDNDKSRPIDMLPFMRDCIIDEILDNEKV